LVAIKSRRTKADWPAIHRELKRPGVTLRLLWEEHRAAHPEGYGYSRFCELSRAWEGRLSPTMRQSHGPVGPINDPAPPAIASCCCRFQSRLCCATPPG
jgi:hypothetical protein